jgi:plastocyanin
MARNRCALVTLLAALAAAGTAGCGDAGDEQALPPKVTVQMLEDSYRPKTAKVPVGGRVTWVNASQEFNTAQSPGVPEVEYDLRKLDAQNKFDIHTLQPGEAQSVVFDTPGKYVYFSSFDTAMRGVVEVVER